MKVTGKKFSILGAAKSGLAASEALIKQGASVFISDIQPEPALLGILQKAGLGASVEFEAGGHTEKVLDADYIVVSPGVRSDLPLLKKAEEKNIPYFSEIELAYRLTSGKRIAITGSNGKTTTTTLIARLCETNFPSVFLGGNIGIPVANFIGKTTPDSAQIIEISSFQLETIRDFKPDVAVITNFYENHLDRYATYQEYIDAKKNIYKNMTADDWLVLNGNQPIMLEIAQEAHCRIAWFGKPLLNSSPSLTTQDSHFIYTDSQNKQTKLFPVSAVKLLGEHNIENVMCALLAAILAGTDPERTEEPVTTFGGVEHRLEWVHEKDGRIFINDSKGTNCKASETALKACNQPIILLAGGRDKGTRLSDWVQTVRNRAKKVILFGEAANRFRAALEGQIPLKTVKNLEQAIKTAYDESEKGDTILLSPACSSYDEFSNFEERGDFFKKTVKAL
ncbi:MAG: UDP-N-acetylmuramoyl-L-alanine--D-glutamate ligase [Candidatus Riflebacteria bacterium]|nr:UDP-N-acetylmuramoyl-L-alanine--D-glutamate ligase [Candidatus Riflebacteria bacterium]